MRVALVARIPKGGSYAFKTVKFAKNGRPIVHESVTAFYLRYTNAAEARSRGIKSKVIVEPVGKIYETALAKYRAKAEAFDRIRRGLPGHENPPAARRKIADAVAMYEARLDERCELWKRGSLDGTKLSPNSARRYRRFIQAFRDVINVEYFDELNAEVINRYKTHLRKTTRGDGAHDRIVADAFQVLNSFLAANSIRLVRGKATLPNDTADLGLISYSDFPKLTKKQKRSKKAEQYSKAELLAMLAVAGTDERDLLQTFLKTGMRRNEVAHFTWDWIDWEKNRISISDQLRFGWRLKDYETRWTPLAPDLRKLLADRRKRLNPKADGLIFPSVAGKPDIHHDRILLDVVSRAKARGAKFTGLIELHKFRKTWATAMLRKYSINDVRQWGGWADLQVLQIYLADSAQTDHTAIAEAFDGV
jgi:integrase